MNAIVQCVETTSRRSLGRDPQCPLQLSHFVDRRTPIGVVGTGLAGHALAITCILHMTTAGPLPSGRVLRRDHPRYYEPLGLPLCSARFRLGLIRATLPRRRRQRRASRVPHFSLHACCALYPAEIGDALRNRRPRCCLRREMSGSALGLFLCRGCRLHFMLRPACLLSAARPAPLGGLSTPRSGHGDLSPCLGPATRRFGAYRDGTFTR